MSDPITSFIGKDHPRDGREWEAQCARCGSSLDWHQCDACGGEGITGPGELYEDDPLWYDMDDYEPCHQCGGEASFPYCISSSEWCDANPLEGREKIESGTPEWFVVERRETTICPETVEEQTPPLIPKTFGDVRRIMQDE